MSMLHPLIGMQIEDYTITAEIFSSVSPQLYLGEVETASTDRAFIALFPDVILSTPKERIHVLSKVQELIDLRHANILPFLSVGFDSENVLYAISQHITNYTLAEYLQYRDQPIPVATVKNIIVNLGEALHYAHTHQVVHGNLSPQAIYLAEQKQALLGHFYCYLLGAEALPTQTPLDPTHPSHFFSPERAEGQISPATDQYALASLAQLLFTGKHPSASSLLPENAQPQIRSAQTLSELNVVFKKALAEDPEERYSDIRSFLDALEHALEPQIFLMFSIRYNLLSLKPSLRSQRSQLRRI